MEAVEAAAVDREGPSVAAFPLVAVIEVAPALLVAAEGVAVFLVEAVGGAAAEGLAHFPEALEVGDTIGPLAAESQEVDLGPV